ncbi:TadE/TadG family type IV pilus assembly protein, partial [Blastomonas sp.]|uniref:TadE/TadG family type IV pilus assembly protein n=1 Tax=Blastomonas sp. TaxID=1909299 RepID=UPI003593A598
MKQSTIRKLIATLSSDQQGNVLPIFAAAIIPLLAMVGGGVDASRGYLTKTQLQNACDAGVLAGRRAMAKTGTYENSERAKAMRMFDANFDAAVVEAQDVNFVTQAGEEGKVFGTASTTIPTVLMKIFGTETMSFSVECMAELQITNSDVMFVLDVTGSMAGTRITGLRQAVRDFHTTITSSVTDDEVRIRYGFVPYSITVNARRLLSTGQMPMDYIANQVPYQSRMAVFDTPVYIASGSSTQDSVQTSPDSLNRNQCDAYGDNYGSNPVDTGSAPGTTTRTTYSFHSRSGGTCRRNVRVVSTNYDTVYQYSYWRYAQSTLDVSALKSFGPVQFVSNVASNGYVPTAGMYDLRTLA